MSKKRLRIAVVTGSRAEFGLLVPVIRAIRGHKRLSPHLIAAGSHFLGPARTIREVEKTFPVAARVPMQQGKHRMRADDARAVARGIDGFGRAFSRLKPDWVLVLGDRIEAFAAASAASIAGIAVAHIHGGDRAEGIADEAMRHAITKLAHLHLAATRQSAGRIIKMGERPGHVHVVGSPAIDGLRDVRALSDARARRLGDPSVVLLLHPSGLSRTRERRLARSAVDGVAWCAPVGVLALSPNQDPGRDEVLRELDDRSPAEWTRREHLPRGEFLGLLRRLAAQRPRRGVLVGNSSAGLIEAAALGVPVVNVGPRQDGRERAGNVIDVAQEREPLWDAIEMAIAGAWKLRAPRAHPFGDGRTGVRIARLLAATDPHDPLLLRKRNTY